MPFQGPLDHPDYDQEGREGSRFDNDAPGLDDWYSRPVDQGGGGADGGTSWFDLCTNCAPGSREGVDQGVGGHPRTYRNIQPFSPDEPMGMLVSSTLVPEWYGDHTTLGPDEWNEGERVDWSENTCSECGTAITALAEDDGSWRIRQDPRLGGRQWSVGRPGSGPDINPVGPNYSQPDPFDRSDPEQARQAKAIEDMNKALGE